MLNNPWKWIVDSYPEPQIEPGLDFGATAGKRWWLELTEIPDTWQNTRASGVHRFSALWPLNPQNRLVSLGEPETPVQEAAQGLWFKLEYLMPTGSYKDRGAAALVAHALAHGAVSLLEDSSGNAGTSLAAYAAKAGLEARIRVPQSISKAKLQGMRSYGAYVELCSETRDEVAKSTRLLAGSGGYFASHTWNPIFFHGTKTFLYELWSQYQNGQVPWPHEILFPTGNGTLMLGSWLALNELAGKVFLPHLPKLSAVQVEGYHPLAATLLPETPAPTLADGIAVRQPLRVLEIKKAIQETGGRVITVSEKEIVDAQKKLGRMGWLVEYASAAGYGAYVKTKRKQEHTLIPLTGNGLKNPS